MRLRMITASGLALLFVASVTAADVTNRVIEGEIYYNQPLVPCEVPSVIMRLAREAQIPVGIEKRPDDCQPLQPLSRSSDVRTYREKVYLTSKHIGEALNELVAADPRYAWAVSVA
jgi:hypothetical protein